MNYSCIIVLLFCQITAPLCAMQNNMMIILKKEEMLCLFMKSNNKDYKLFLPEAYLKDFKEKRSLSSLRRNQAVSTPATYKPNKVLNQTILKKNIANFLHFSFMQQCEDEAFYDYFFNATILCGTLLTLICGIYSKSNHNQKCFFITLLGIVLISLVLYPYFFHQRYSNTEEFIKEFNTNKNMLKIIMDIEYTNPSFSRIKKSIY